MARTKKDYEDHLNEAEMQFEDLEYITNPVRGNYISARKLRKDLGNNKAGTLLRKYDPIAFEAGYQDWR